MKKILAVLTMAFAMQAQATNWISVEENKDGLQLLVDGETFSPGVVEGKIPVVGAVFQYIKLGEPQGLLVYMTQVEACKDNGGIILGRVEKNGQWTTIEKYFWTKTGRHFYDSAANSLCTMLEVMMQQKNPAKAPPKNSSLL